MAINSGFDMASDDAKLVHSEAECKESATTVRTENKCTLSLKLALEPQVHAAQAGWPPPAISVNATTVCYISGLYFQP